MCLLRFIYILIIYMRSFISYLKSKNINETIPCNDCSAWIKFSEHNFIYDKLRLAEIQNLDCSPIPIIPVDYPVIIKPIMNLYGMSRGFYKVNSREAYDKLSNQVNLSGYFWEKYLKGLQYNIDLVIKDGIVIKYYALESYPCEEATFKYHKYVSDYKLGENIIELIEQLLESYTGFLNIEIINNYIIEAHLRLNGDSFLFNDKHYENFVRFIETNVFIDEPIKPITFFPIFINKNNKNYDINLIEQYLKNNLDIDDYCMDDIDCSCQGDIYKRCCYFTCYDFLKGIDIQNIIKKSIIM